MEDAVAANDNLLIGLCLLVAIALNTMAWQLGYYRKPNTHQELPWITKGHLFVMLLAFFVLQMFLIPLGVQLFIKYFTTLKVKGSQYSSEVMVWLNIAVGLFCGPLLWLLSNKLDPHKTKMMFGPLKSMGKNFALGVASWLIVFPLAQLLEVILEFIVTSVFDPPQVDQAPVELFKSAFANPVQFWLTFICLSTFVPFAEELLMRGYLQGYLRTRIGVGGAIFFASVVFASMHFSFSHGWRNMEILPVLFFVSCYMGYLYERQQSLWASIGLHAAFNFASVSMITYQGV